MKKRSLRAIIMVLIMMVSLGAMINLNAAFAAGDFELVESYPKDGATNAAVENLGAKLTFSTAVTDEKNHAANSKCFKMIGPEGTELPIKVFFNPKDDTQILVVYDINEGGQIAAKASDTYKVIISGDLRDDAGNTLGEEITISFTTINQSRNMRIYFIIMLLMMAAMAFMTMRQQSKAMAEANAAKAVPTKEEPFNPYKEAKRTGKSVEEVIAAHEKEVAKMEAKMAKAKGPREYVFDDDDDDNGNYKVKGPRPASAAGSKFVENRRNSKK